MVEMFKALADENRLRIINILMKEELCVCEIEVLLEMSQSNVSRHLAKLKSAGLILSSKDAQWIHYRFNETFALENPSMAEYLKSSCQKDEGLKRDATRCSAYKNSNYDCQDIRNDKEMVMNYIQDKVGEK